MMTDAATFSVRFGMPSDLHALRVLERTYFPAVPGERHAGYIFENQEQDQGRDGGLHARGC
ncbi:hypothetical protein [Microbacterium sp. 13-71-7]|jgi:hypothetical protein|uniref:hypothetical protein n=1 Tax=Microbacterium sp. 13-71-7 TaxID=1970399 RepID=UPI0025F1B7B6|nr:hypothetical protein [Microbacterium sp. 13-71-7]